MSDDDYSGLLDDDHGGGSDDVVDAINFQLALDEKPNAL